MGRLRLFRYSPNKFANPLVRGADSGNFDSYTVSEFIYIIHYPTTVVKTIYGTDLPHMAKSAAVGSLNKV